MLACSSLQGKEALPVSFPFLQFFSSSRFRWLKAQPALSSASRMQPQRPPPNVSLPHT